MLRRREFLAATAAALTTPLSQLTAAEDRHLLYIAQPGIRNYVSYGGVGVLVYDIGKGYEFVKRIPTWHMPEGKDPRTSKVAASAKTSKLYVTTIRRVGCIDLLTEQMTWEKELEGGCDRLAISPDGKILYVPSLEGPHWNVVNALTGDVITKVVTKSGAHNTVYSLDGRRVYLAGLRSPFLSVVDTKKHAVVSTVGPFGNFIRPFTVNAAQTLCYVNVNELLGFEIGEIRSGKKLHRVEVKGYAMGPVARHGCPSHGVGLTPDEREVCVRRAQQRDAHRQHRHAAAPDDDLEAPRSAWWITFSIDTHATHRPARSSRRLEDGDRAATDRRQIGSES